MLTLSLMYMCMYKPLYSPVVSAVVPPAPLPSLVIPRSPASLCVGVCVHCLLPQELVW